MHEIFSQKQCSPNFMEGYHWGLLILLIAGIVGLIVTQGIARDT